MPIYLLITIRLHDARYHGAGDWPPSPARLFQALVAGAARGGQLDHSEARALNWLEEQPAPIIATPCARAGQTVTLYVPNNDLDAKGGHPRNIGPVRTAKHQRAYLLDAHEPFLYLWQIGGADKDRRFGQEIQAITKHLYQFGRGIDMAWGFADMLEPDIAEARLAEHRGPIFRPCGGTAGINLACPTMGSLASLIDRHQAQALRFIPTDNKGGLLFSQPPRPRFHQVAYDSPPRRILFEIRDAAGFAPWSIANAVNLVETLRDKAAEKLITSLPQRAADITRLLIGRGATPTDQARRPRLIPLPSVGATHADHAIRRVLLEVPGLCPLSPEDLAWALSGLVLNRAYDPNTGEVLAETRLLHAEDDSMLRYFGIGMAPARRWRSVTPVALPARAHAPSPRDGSARMAEAEADASALRQAMRHAGIDSPAAFTALQREPFAARGTRADEFAPGTRFTAQRLRHVEITFQTPRHGPLLLGDGRYLGLGLFAPVREVNGLHIFQIAAGLAQETPDAGVLTRALRRAVMARVQAQLGTQRLPTYFSGHDDSGGPLREGGQAHLAFTFDPVRHRLCIVAPHLLSARTRTRDDARQLELLDSALDGLTELRAGAAGLLQLVPDETGAADLLGPSKHWTSATPYTVTRHAKRLSAAGALIKDVVRECDRRGLPAPDVDVLATQSALHGLSGTVKLHFATAQTGPILLGRQAHLGGGLFRPDT